MTRDEAAIETAKLWGWKLNPKTNKWHNPDAPGGGTYVNNERWGRYVCEDYGLAVQEMPTDFDVLKADTPCHKAGAEYCYACGYGNFPRDFS